MRESNNQTVLTEPDGECETAAAKVAINVALELQRRSEIISLPAKISRGVGVFSTAAKLFRTSADLRLQG
jgi:hypothetical protein